MTKLFKSHKLVTAIAMTRLAYNNYRGWELPEDENGEDEGYLVEYVEGGKSNHPDHEGYISWSPKEQFDNGYTEVVNEPVPSVGIMKYFEYGHLPPHLQAVSKPIGELAILMHKTLPDGAEKSAGLRKLLEAKDCLVRAKLG